MVQKQHLRRESDVILPHAPSLLHPSPSGGCQTSFDGQTEKLNKDCPPPHHLLPPPTFVSPLFSSDHHFACFPPFHASVPGWAPAARLPSPRLASPRLGLPLKNWHIKMSLNTPHHHPPHSRLPRCAFLLGLCLRPLHSNFDVSWQMPYYFKHH